MLNAHPLQGRAREGRRFLVALVVLFGLYFSALPWMRRALVGAVDSVVVSVPFFLGWLAAAQLFLILSRHLPRPRLGHRELTRPDLLAAAVITLGLMGAAATTHAALLRAGVEVPTAPHAPWAVALYALFVPVQEYMARGVLLGGLLEYAQGSWGPALSCVVCAGLYASLHLYLGVSIALVVFIPGLLWSYLYYRSRSVLLVSASHLACGLFYLYVLGV